MSENKTPLTMDWDGLEALGPAPADDHPMDNIKWTPDTPQMATEWTSVAGTVKAGYAWNFWTAIDPAGNDLGTFGSASAAKDRCEDNYVTGR